MPRAIEFWPALAIRADGSPEVPDQVASKNQVVADAVRQSHGARNGMHR
jgi:hypothetical protein